MSSLEKEHELLKDRIPVQIPLYDIRPSKKDISVRIRGRPAMEPEDVLKAIDRILNEPEPTEPYDPAFPGLDREWWKRKTSELLEPAKGPARTVPIVGCVIQRSDHQQRRKQQWLTTPPPPLPVRRPASRTEGVTLEPARVMGPLPPPPIPVEVEPGIIVDVPHFAAHVARRYKTHVGGRRWTIRFNANGTVRSTRENAKSA